MKNKALILVIIFFSLISCSKKPNYNFVIQNVGFFDGYQDRGVVNIAINMDTIAAITTEELIGDSLINGAGKYVIPGLVNAHVHVTSLDDMKEGYPYGILTNLNMHTGLEDRELAWKKISRDSAAYSLLYGAGTAATVPGGHPTQFSPDMETINDTMSVRQWVDSRIAHGVDYIKIIRENHSHFQHPPQPTLSYQQIKEIIDYSHSKGYKVVVHITKAIDMAEIAKFRPDGFVHMWCYTQGLELTEEQWKTIKESGSFVIPTAIFIVKGHLNFGDIENETMSASEAFEKDWIENNLITEEQSIEGIKKLHELGVRLVAGTDPPSDEINFGNDLLRELELYQQAGMGTIEVLRTATGNVAKAFDLPIGELKIGGKANMVLLSGNPLSDLQNLRKVDKVWKNGKTK